jgi:hypothetical protein
MQNVLAIKIYVIQVFLHSLQVKYDYIKLKIRKTSFITIDLSLLLQLYSQTLKSIN